MRNKGITLISLVITIIVLIILAGIAINLSISENGIFTRAKQAKDKYINSEEQEREQLNNAYGQMLVATGENATITLTMKQLNDLIDERINSKMYIDTSKKITELAADTEYVATKDCIILGYINCSHCSGYNIEIDGIYVGRYVNNSSENVAQPVYFLLKSGQKIIFKTRNSSCSIEVSAYETLTK